ncbi:MAG: SMP-30/gluconolactonase/LRE family protein [Microthrixaceae bacterium]
MRAVLRPGADVERLCTGAVWSEGPVWIDERAELVWSDIPNNRMLAWSAERGMRVYRAPSNFSNGNTLDREGRIVTCEHGRRCVSRTGTDHQVEVLVDRYRGGRLNSPNDVVVKSNGTIWFTDPPYGIISNHEGYAAPSEQGDRCYVFRFDPATGELRIAEDSFAKPNGLAFSPDERWLYVTDTSGSHDPGGNHHLRRFAVTADDRLVDGTVFAVVAPGLPDGFRVDEAGRLFVSAEDGVQVFDPDGTLLGKLLIPERTANCEFGGPGRDVLYVTASTSLYRIALATRGAARPRK